LARAAVVVIGIGVAAYALGERSRANRLAEQLAQAILDQRALRASLDSNARMIDQLVGPAVQVVELTSSGERRPSGRMFWDQASDSWTFIAHDLPPLPAGRTYQLWLIDAGQQKISAGTFAPESNGNALVRAQYRLSPDSLAVVAVTEEPEGGVPQPTGSIVLAGSAGRGESR
jgi:anti-sigma-K factor RskA